VRYCFSCRHITGGKPLFCNHCGKSYDVKLCVRLHQNPRRAEACSQCGSRELSTPQRYVPWWRKVFLMTAPISGILLLLLSVAYFIYFALQVFSHPSSLLRPMLLGLLLGLLWLIYMA
jgi:hypothetical protein